MLRGNCCARSRELDTGHRRDYGEGVAYREYFATDRLMFNVPKLDECLSNKAEVLALRFSDAPGVLVWLVRSIS